MSSESFKKWRHVTGFKGVHERKNWAHIAILFEAGWIIVQLKDFQACYEDWSLTLLFRPLPLVRHG